MIFLGFLFSIIHSTDGGVDDFAISALISAVQEKNKEDKQNGFDFTAIILTNADHWR